jgi:hypothetical protein
LLEKSSQKSPTTGSKIAKMLFGTQKNKALFNVFVPLSKDQFSKRDFFDSFNGWHLQNRARRTPPLRSRGIAPLGSTLLFIGGADEYLSYQDDS